MSRLTLIFDFYMFDMNKPTNVMSVICTYLPVNGYYIFHCNDPPLLILQYIAVSGKLCTADERRSPTADITKDE